MPPRLLIVDDNRDAADSLALVFGLSGADVRVAYDGRDGLAQATDFGPHAGLFDINMPVMDGLDLARALRTTPHPSPLLLVALTGVSDEEGARERTTAAGFDAHFTKPARLDELVAVVWGFLREAYPDEV